MRPFLALAAVLAAMSEGSSGGGGTGDPRDDELAKLREENARLRSGRRPPPESDVDRAIEEQALRGRAEPDTDEARQMRAEESGRQVETPKEKRSGEAVVRDLIRVIQGSAQFHHASSEQAQRDLDALRVELGDEDLGAHVALRDYHRALANHNAHPATPAGNVAHAAEVERTRKALEANPLAKKRLDDIERARRRGEPVDFTTENEGATR